jgi:uncharacterized protein YlzI (FlbEa/FlbD family)
VIALHRPNGHPVYVNPDLLETAERDAEGGLTTVVLTSGNVLMVRDEPQAISDAIVVYRRRIAASA